MRRAQLIGLVGIVVASGLWATPAVGQVGNSGNELLGYCAESLKPEGDPTWNQLGSGLCIGYVGAITDVSTFSDNPLYRRVCPPAAVTTGQLVRVVYNWLEDHPERLHEASIFLVIEATRDAFPCSP